MAGRAVEMPGGRTLNRETIDVGPHGVKVRLDETVGSGSRARLRFQPPDRQPLDLESIVWRNDSDDPVFVFVNMPAEDFEPGRQSPRELMLAAGRPRVRPQFPLDAATRALALFGQSASHRDLVRHFGGGACH
jgi:PilZ domain-containing protein